MALIFGMIACLIASPSVLATSQGTPEVAAGVPADPALCTGAARPVEDLQALSNEPPGALARLIQGTPEATPEGTPATPITAPEGGEPADQAVVDAVTKVVVKHTACANASDLLRDTALWTDDLVRAELAGLSEGQIAELTTPKDIPASAWSLIPEVRDVRIHPTGEVTAVLQTAEVTAIAVFVEVDGRYLIDHTSELPAPSGSLRTLPG